MKILRILSIIIAAIAMVGFGLCGLLGVAAGFEPAKLGNWFNIFFFLGVSCLIVCGSLLRFLVKKFRNPPDMPGR